MAKKRYQFEIDVWRIKMIEINLQLISIHLQRADPEGERLKRIKRIMNTNIAKYVAEQIVTRHPLIYSNSQMGTRTP